MSESRGSALLSPEAAAVVVFALIPLTFIAEPRLLGSQPSGLAWIGGGAALTVALLMLPVRRRYMLSSLPYVAFLLVALISLVWVRQWQHAPPTLLQMAVPVLGYVVGCHVAPSAVRSPIARISRVAIVVAALLVLAEEVLGGVTLITVAARPLGICLALLFITAVLDSPSFIRTVSYGSACAGVGFLTGSRTASAVVVLLILSSPSLKARLWQRVVIAALLVAGLLALAETPAFKERFFFNPDQASLQDAFQLSSQLNTAGRRELWPKLVEACGEAQPLGFGIGSSIDLVSELSGGVMAHPHNDYLRIWCDTGTAGSIPFWSFFALAAWHRIARVVRRRGDPVLQLAGAQAVLALLLFAITDNPVIYTAHFLTPALLLMGIAVADTSADEPWHADVGVSAPLD